MQGIFSKEFGPRTYSVISYATVGKVTQRVIAIVKKVNRQKAETKLGDASSAQVDNVQSQHADDGSKQEKNKYDIKVLRLYWI